MRVLALESSCDESAAAVYDDRRGLLAHELYSQVELHRRFGGVVPELASRDHVQRLLPLVDRALAAAHTGAGEIDGVAYTAGPGLVGALLCGAALARALAAGWNKPAIGVHHLEGHLLAPLLEDPPPPFPHLALLVSGGHTMLIDVRAIGDYRLLGETRDDAAGEAFDKSAKLLGLPYPGGPELAALADSHSASRTRAIASRDAQAFRLPRPMRDRAGFEFSFSGLKTAVALAVHAAPLDDTRRALIAAELQAAVIDTLCTKALRALEHTGHSALVVSGGVSANRALRARLTAETARMGAGVWFPRPAFCTDNAAMIALAGLKRLAAGEHDGGGILVRARWPLDELAPPGAARQSAVPVGS